ncbi:MAG: GNAT family acetyltransferase [Lachnospiraceae bacterium]|nr:GNAT family acetyltransferase [Lachnospiraceae bacterium]
MIDPNTISVNFIKKEPFTGGYRGMRYQLVKSAEGMEVTIWPEPYNFLHTPEEKKQKKQFALTKEGRDEAVAWMNEQYEEQKEVWDLALNTAWTVQ